MINHSNVAMASNGLPMRPWLWGSEVAVHGVLELGLAFERSAGDYDLQQGGAFCYM
jgi:hypothetical protein